MRMRKGGFLGTNQVSDGPDRKITNDVGERKRFRGASAGTDEWETLGMRLTDFDFDSMEVGPSVESNAPQQIIGGNRITKRTESVASFGRRAARVPFDAFDIGTAGSAATLSRARGIGRGETPALSFIIFFSVLPLKRDFTISRSPGSHGAPSGVILVPFYRVNAEWMREGAMKLKC